jgi:hypothetical protein
VVGFCDSSNGLSGYIAKGYFLNGWILIKCSGSSELVNSSL